MNTDPLIIYFTLTKACNLTCLHCVRSHTPHNTYQQDIQTMSSKDALTVLSTLASYYPNATLAITGGEPTLHPNFEQITLKCISLFKSVVLTTNGLFSDVKKDKLISLTGNNNFYIQISLDGNETTHDSIRGIGSFQKTFLRIKELSEKCRPKSVSISTTVSQLNKDSMFELANILKKVPLAKWRIAPEQIFNAEDLVRQIPSNEWNTFVDKILKVCFFKISIKKVFDFILMDKSLANFSQDRIIRSNCGFGKYKLYVYPDFTVLPCTCMPHMKISNLLTDNIEEVNSKLTQCIPKLIKGSICEKCKYLPVCNGGCVGYSFHYNGKIGFGDIRCPIINRKVE